MIAIAIPDPVALIDIETGRPLSIAGETHATFVNFVRGRLSDPQFARDMAAVESAERICAALHALTEDAQQLLLEQAEHALLVRVTRAPARGYPGNIAHCALPFMRAICNATEVEGSEK